MGGETFSGGRGGKEGGKGGGQLIRVEGTTGAARGGWTVV